MNDKFRKKENSNECRFAKMRQTTERRALHDPISELIVEGVWVIGRGSGRQRPSGHPGTSPHGRGWVGWGGGAALLRKFGLWGVERLARIHIVHCAAGSGYGAIS